MKALMRASTLFFSILFIYVFGSATAQFLNCSPLITCGGLAALSVGATILKAKGLMPSGLSAGLYREVWTGEMIKRLSHAESNAWLNGIVDQSRFVTGNDEAQVIHMASLGVKPDVLINNSTYPIDVQDLALGDIPISLDKYQTKATPITDDEVYALATPKMAPAIEQHGLSIMETKQDKALHAIAPASNAAKTPVMRTTGADDGTGRKRMTRDDIIAHKKAYDDMKAPLAGRRLVLCPDHVADLLLVDQKFADQYYNYTTGKIANLYGFEVFEYVVPPAYIAAGTKKSYGASLISTDRTASVSFLTSRVVKADGKTLTYMSNAKQDPLIQRNLINFRHYFIVMPLAPEAVGAIVSGIV